MAALRRAESLRGSQRYDGALMAGRVDGTLDLLTHWLLDGMHLQLHLLVVRRSERIVRS